MLNVRGRVLRYGSGFGIAKGNGVCRRSGGSVTLYKMRSESVVALECGRTYLLEVGTRVTENLQYFRRVASINDLRRNN